MLTKIIKPGQLFTAKGKVFRCCKQTAKEYDNEFVCETCELVNQGECLGRKYNFNCFILHSERASCYPKLLNP